MCVNIPTFLKNHNQFEEETLARDQKVASKRVHIERIIGLAKTYKILCQPLNDIETQLGLQILFVCFMLCNLRSCIIPATLRDVLLILIFPSVVSNSVMRASQSVLMVFS